MALLGINPVSSEPNRPSTLEKIALGFQIANNAVGAITSVPKAIYELGILKEQKKMMPYEAASKFSNAYSPSEEGAKGSQILKGPLDTEPRWYAPKVDLGEVIQAQTIQKNNEYFKDPTEQDFEEAADKSGYTIDFLKRNYPHAGDIKGLMDGISRRMVVTPGLGQQKTEFDWRKFDNIKTRYEKLVDARNKERDAIYGAKELLDQGASVSVAMAGTLLRRAKGKDVGNQSYQEVQMILPNSAPGIVRGIWNKITGQTDAPFSKEELAALRSIADRAITGSDLLFAEKVFDFFESEQASDPQLYNANRAWFSVIEKQTNMWDDIKDIKDLEYGAKNEPDPNKKAMALERAALLRMRR